MCRCAYIYIKIIGFTLAKIFCDFCHSSVFCEALQEISIMNLPQMMQDWLHTLIKVCFTRNARKRLLEDTQKNTFSQNRI